MSNTKPKLPNRKGGPATAARKAAPSSTSLPILKAEHIQLEDGTQIPVKIPPGMSAEQAQSVIAFLRANPDAAKAAWDQAQTMMKAGPQFVNAVINMRNQPSSAENLEVFEALKDDEELKHVFEDMQKRGPQALQQYWDDTELMSKISLKLRAFKLSKQETAGSDGSTATSTTATTTAEGSLPVPIKTAPPAPAKDLSTLHDAAKWGDVAATKRLLEGGADVNGLNERGIAPLGVAVGFNRREVVEALLEAGADVMQRDKAGNTVLHYASGYGRKEIAALLLEAGAELEANNNAKQRPADVAKVNGELHMVEFLKSAAASAAGKTVIAA